MSETDQSTNVPQPVHAKSPAPTSCRMKKKDDASFLEDLKDHIDEFINASMDEHKTCFKKAIEKIFGISKKVAERNSSNEGVESSLPLKTALNDKKQVVT